MAKASIVDHGWSWVVCFASFVVQFIVLGIQNSYGTFFIEFLQEFHKGESATAWVGSIAFGLTFMNGPLATALCARWGSRLVTCLGGAISVFGLLMTSYVDKFSWLYVTYGLIWGLGASMAYFGSIAALTSYFRRHLSLAYGICLSGSGAGTPVMIVLLDLFIKSYGWRITFQSAAGICALIFLCGLSYLPNIDQRLLKQDPQKQKKHVLRSGSACQRSASVMRTGVRQVIGLFFDPIFWQDRAFVMWVAALGFVIFGYFIPFVFVIRMAKDIGVPDTQSTLLIAYLAITQTVFKVVFGRIGDVFRSKRIQILQAILLLQAVATTLCPLASQYGYPVLVAYVIIFGFCDGCWSVMVGMGTELIVGKAMMPRAFGNLYGVIAIPLILGPPVSGCIFDKLGRYDVAFFLSGGTIVVGICLMFMVQRQISEEPHTRFEVCLAEENKEDKEHLGDPRHKLIVDCEVGLAGSRAASQVLIHRRSYLGNDPLSSRPCSLIISRLLEREILEEQMSNDYEVWESNENEQASNDYEVWESNENEQVSNEYEVWESNSYNRVNELDPSVPAVVWSHLEMSPPSPTSHMEESPPPSPTSHMEGSPPSPTSHMEESPPSPTSNMEGSPPSPTSYSPASHTDIHRLSTAASSSKTSLKNSSNESVDSGKSTGSRSSSEKSLQMGFHSDSNDSAYDGSSTEDIACTEYRHLATIGRSCRTSSKQSLEEDATCRLSSCMYSSRQEVDATDLFSKLMEKALEINGLDLTMNLTAENEARIYSIGNNVYGNHRDLDASRETVL